MTNEEEEAAYCAQVAQSITGCGTECTNPGTDWCCDHLAKIIARERLAGYGSAQIDAVEVVKRRADVAWAAAEDGEDDMDLMEEMENVAGQLEQAAGEIRGLRQVRTLVRTSTPDAPATDGK